MWLRVTSALVMASAFLPSIARAGDDQTMGQFLVGIYHKYEANTGDKDDGTLPFDSDANVRKYFSHRLAELLIIDRNNPEGPCLNYDPIVFAQDWTLSNLHVRTKPIGPDFGLGFVRFKNGQEQSLLFELSKVTDGWRIDDILSATGTNSTTYFLESCLADFGKLPAPK